MAIFWTVGIVVACSLPAASLSPVEPVLSFDKVAHFGLFTVFGVLWMRVLCPPGSRTSRTCLRRRGSAFIVIGLLFAAGTEVYQDLLPVQRVADPYDAVADAAGLTTGSILYMLYISRRAPEETSL